MEIWKSLALLHLYSSLFILQHWLQNLYCDHHENLYSSLFILQHMALDIAFLKDDKFIF